MRSRLPPSRYFLHYLSHFKATFFLTRFSPKICSPPSCQKPSLNSHSTKRQNDKVTCGSSARTKRIRTARRSLVVRSVTWWWWWWSSSLSWGWWWCWWWEAWWLYWSPCFASVAPQLSLLELSPGLKILLLSCENISYLVHSSDKADGEDGEDQAGDELEGDAKKPQDKREYQAFPLFFVFSFRMTCTATGWERSGGQGPIHGCW